MKKSIVVLVALFIEAHLAFSQCTPDPSCTPAQLICPSALPAGCQGEGYSEAATISLGSTVAGISFVDITLTGMTGLPAGFSFSCNPSNCKFLPNTNSCVLISGTTNVTGTYIPRAQLVVNLGLFTLPIDTPIGAIIINAKDCAGVCAGTASVDNCGICSGGTTGILPDCDDADPCTTDNCNFSGGCIHTTMPCDDSDPCTDDGCSGGLCYNDPVLCDDLNACTDDACITGGVCLNSPVVCDDGDICTGIETCHSINGCETGTPLFCDDGDACNGDETCNSLTGCMSGTAMNCDDSDTCTIDACNAGQCEYSLNANCADPCIGVSCDDASACTVDTCSLGQCYYTPVGCDDGDECSGIETCDSGAGCQAGIPLNCDDADVCTTDGCDALSGCTYFAIGCDDGDPCTLDQCDAVFGCDYTTPVDCDDFDACTTDGCDALTGCTTAQVICEDLDACTDDACDPLTGCTVTATTCDDFDACTTDGCDPQTGCTITPICDDADACTTDGCDPLTGCITTPFVCDDVDSCTLDSCNPLTGCVFEPNPACANGIYQHNQLTTGINIQAFPNPFADNLTILFSVSVKSKVTLDILDLSGRKLATLFNGDVEGGKNFTVEFNSTSVSEGLLVYRLATEGGVIYGKAVLVR